MRKVAGHAAQSVPATHASQAVVEAARSGRIAVGIHRWCAGSEALAAPGCEGTASRPATGGASGELQGAVGAAAGGQARRLVA